MLVGMIRTIVAMGSEFSIGAGGGIVALSSASAEYDEMALKAEASISAMLSAAKAGENFGTTKWLVKNKIKNRSL